MSTLTSFVASLIALRLAGRLARSHQPAWAAGLFTYAVASAALAWGSAHGWDARAFRVYYLSGGLLTAPLLGAGSLLLVGRRFAAPVAFLYAGLATGVALAMPVDGPFSSTTVPTAAQHLGTLPRVVAIAGNSAGTLAVVAVALLTLRRRPLGNVLLLAGIAVAAAGSGLAGTDVSLLAACAAIAALLLYAGVEVGEERFRRVRRRAAC